MTTWILGGFQTDFARAYAKEGLDISDLIAETTRGTLEACRVDPGEIETIHVGNAFGELYNGQGHLGAAPASMIPELWGVPAMRHEAACASSSVAVLAAMAELEAERYDVALVLGVEQERTMPGSQAARVQTAASWVGREYRDVEFVWPHTFDALADEYDRRFGLDDGYLRAIARLNRNNARTNPSAQTRSWVVADAEFGTDDTVNPVVAGRLRRTDCCQITDGGVGLVVVSQRWRDQHESRQTQRGTWSRVAGWGHRTVGLGFETKLGRDERDPYVLSHVRRTITDAWERAGVSGIDDIDAIEAHDCMTPSEYMAIDHFGITAPGESWKAIEDGSIERDGAMPINPGGGLIGGGHPVGATGARMVLDAAKQVTGQAGDVQVDGARRVQTLNIGGSTATTVSFIVDNGDPA